MYLMASKYQHCMIIQSNINRYLQILSKLLIIIEKEDFDATVCGAAFIAKAVMRMVAEH